MIGELINHYRVLQLIGSGAMGVVYKALDVNLDRLVAIKVMSIEVRSDPDFVERFRQEARLQAALNHPNIALLFDYFIHDDAPVAVMEWILGESLEQLIRRRGPIPAHEALPLFKQALRGVAAAHRAGIIHRDLKPGNLMIARDNIVKVMDFGIAKRQGVTGATKVSTSIGSPLYMAPEQILGRAVDCRTDVYALGVTLYQLLSGQPPFNPRGKSEYVLLSAHVNDLPQPPTTHCRDIPQPIADVVMRALAKEPDARFQSADEFMRALPELRAPDAAGSAATLSQEPAARPTAPPLPVTASPAATATVVLTRPMAASQRDPPVPSSAPPAGTARGLSAAPSGLPRLLRANRRVVVAALAALVIGTLIRYSEQHLGLRATSLGSRAASVPNSSAQALARPSVDMAAATRAPATATPSAKTAAPAQAHLSGTWRGDYVDAAGKRLLRIVNLSISYVHNDGGIEGTLQYETESGEGECKLRPRGSTYLAGEQRLQLSPEACSPHYPKELGVPLDFDGVDPRANILYDGRIEAPTGETIRVNLRRMGGL